MTQPTNDELRALLREAREIIPWNTVEGSRIKSRISAMVFRLSEAPATLPELAAAAKALGLVLCHGEPVATVDHGVLNWIDGGQYKGPCDLHRPIGEPNE